MNALKDNFSRVIDYLRLSVTDRCNLRCIYCMPLNGVPPIEHKDILTYEEITRIVKVAAGIGVKKVRLTGGEPLNRKDISSLISSIKNIGGITDISMTTNGVQLEKYSKEIADAGLDRVNISIDSFLPDRYRAITRGGDLNTVLRGLHASERAGLKPIKINMVPVRGVNDDEITEFAGLTINSDYHVRFIEFMPSGSVEFWSPEKYIATDEIKCIIEKLGPLEPVRLRKNGPSKYFRLKGAKGVVGFISALTHHFCGDCNRIRLTADGKIKPCLFSETEIDIRSSLRNNSPDSEIERLLRLSVEIKPKEHRLSSYKIELQKQNENNHNSLCFTQHSLKRPMSKIGG